MLITEHEGNVEYATYGISPDNATLVYATNEHGEFWQAWQHDLESGEKTLLVDAPWDVSYVVYSRSGHYRVSGINADARTEVTIVDTDDSPSNIHVIDLADGNSRQLTSALNPGIDQSHLVRSEVVRYKSFDGLEIPSILYKPHRASAENPVPAMVLVHGGPGGQTRTGYRAMVQHLVNHGYAILGANNRGSSGYGKTFHHMDDKRHGEEDLQDIVYGRKYLESLEWVDAGKIGVIGGSYGGYMVAAALAFEPEVFDVGINIFGVTNWVRTLQSIPPWWEAQKEALYDELGDPATDAERHRRISPLFHAENVVKPTLVVQGANDPRVLQVESDELVAAIQANEVPVEYIVFPDEGHGFRKKSNRIVASDAYVRFLDTYLKGEPSR
jgi:dipeptidyl aminopeptidase/acylaminoacyl peptidase